MNKFDRSPNLRAFIQDATRFAVSNRSIIERAPLQAYYSALVFALEKSIVRETFERCIPSWIQRKPKVEAHWSAMLQTLEGHSAPVASVAFSPDGKQVVSGLHVSGEWLVEGTARYLWLPTNYRPTCEAVWGRIIILGHSSGRLSFLQIQQGLNLLI